MAEPRCSGAFEPRRSSSTNEKEHGAVELFGQFRPHSDLFVARTELLDVLDLEAGTDEEVQCRAEGPMMLYDAFGEPIRRARPSIR